MFRRLHVLVQIDLTHQPNRLLWFSWAQHWPWVEQVCWHLPVLNLLLIAGDRQFVVVRYKWPDLQIALQWFRPVFQYCKV